MGQTIRDKVFGLLQEEKSGSSECRLKICTVGGKEFRDYVIKSVEDDHFVVIEYGQTRSSAEAMIPFSAVASIQTGVKTSVM